MASPPSPSPLGLFGTDALVVEEELGSLGVLGMHGRVLTGQAAFR